MDRKILAPLAGLVAALGIAAALFGGAFAVADTPDPQPKYVAGTTSCTTGATGYCKIGFQRTLRAPAEAVVVTPVLGATQSGYVVSIAAGSFKADGVNIRATRSGSPLAGVQVTVSYFAQEPYLDLPQ
jgi:hypothetical protein